MRTTRATALAAVLGSLLLPATATATEFEGRCALEGITTFDRSITALPDFAADAGYAFRSSEPSTCTGTLDGASFDAPVSVEVDGRGIIGCTGAGSTVGEGWINFTPERPVDDDPATPAPTLLRFTMGYLGAGGSVNFLIEGVSGGRAAGNAQFLTSAGPDTATGCAGDGIREVGFGAVAVTDPTDPLRG